MEGIGECVPLLEDALHRVDSFHRDVTAGRCEDQSGLESRAEELRDSLVTFLALACQLRAYYESISAEMARGQMSYTSSALTSLSSALAAPTFAEL